MMKNFIFFFRLGVIENAFMYVVLDSAESIPAKLKTLLFSSPGHVPETTLALLPCQILLARYAELQLPSAVTAWPHSSPF